MVPKDSSDEMEETKDTMSQGDNEVSDVVEFAGFEPIKESLQELVNVKVVERSLNDIKGVLVHGPAGIGKSLLIQTVLSAVEGLTVIRLGPAQLIEGGEQI